MKYTFCFIVLLVIIGCETAEKRRDRFFELGNLALEDRDYEKAINLYNESLKSDSRFALALNNRGVARMESDHPYEAILDYNQAVLLNPEYLDALFNRAYANESIGNFDKSLRDVDLIMNLKEDSAFVHFYKGLVLTKMKDYERSLKSFLVADSLNPLNPETLINIATVHYFTDNLQLAKDVLSQAFELRPKEPNAINLSSLIALAEEDYLKALVEVNRALDEVVEEPYFLNNRGYVYLQMDSLELAINDINRSILLNPKNGWAYRNKGIYLLKIGEVKQAIRLFERALEEPDFIDEIYSYLGDAYFQDSNLDSACEVWSKGAELNESRSALMLSQNCD